MFPLLPMLALTAPCAQQPGAPAPVAHEEFQLHSSGGAYELELGALLQMNLTAFPGGSAGRVSETEFRRFRLEIGGTLDQIWRFNFEPNFAADGVELEEAWIGFELPFGALLMLGRMKEPFGMEESTPRKRQDFPEYSMLNRWSPAEDHGITVHGEAADGELWYGVAAYNGTGGEEVNNDKDLAVRLAWRPLGPPSADGAQSFLQLAANATWGVADEDLAGKELFQDARQAFADFETGARLDGTRVRLGSDLTWLTGPNAFMAEVIRIEEEATGSLGAGEPVTRGWLFSATRMLTGEARTWKGVHPQHALGADGWGAWQVAARWSEMRFDEAWTDLGMLLPSESASAVRTLDVGLNWYPTRSVSWKLHLLHSFYADEILIGGEPSDGETALLLQVQFAF